MTLSDLEWFREMFSATAELLMMMVMTTKLSCYLAVDDSLASNDFRPRSHRLDSRGPQELRRDALWRYVVVNVDARGDVSLAAVVLVELRAALAPGRRHAAVPSGTGLTHPVTPARCRVFNAGQEQNNSKDYHGHTADWLTSHSSYTASYSHITLQQNFNHRPNSLDYFQTCVSHFFNG